MSLHSTKELLSLLLLSFLGTQLLLLPLCNSLFEPVQDNE